MRKTSIILFPLAVLTLGTLLVSEGLQNKPEPVVTTLAVSPVLDNDKPEILEVRQRLADKAKKVEAAKRAAAEREKARLAEIERLRRASELKKASRAREVSSIGKKTSPRPEAQPKAAAYTSASAWASSARAVRLRQCESGGNYSINTGNGYYGAYQFNAGTWRSVGGTGLPHQHGKAEQDYRAYLLWKSRGWSPWPHCGFA